MRKLYKNLLFFTVLACTTLFWCGLVACAPGSQPDGGVGDGAGQPDGASQPDGSTSPSERRLPPPTPVTALPASTFVYVHYPRSGGVGHLYTYDTATNKAALLTKLDDQGTSGTTTPQISLSPDRKWIAMSAYFRAGAGDLATKLATPAIWLVSVDGKQYRRVTEPIPNPHLTGAECSINSQCTTTGYCNTEWKRCAFSNYRIGLSRPQWSHDSKMLWTVMSTHWTSGGKVAGGAVPASVSAAGGTLQIHANASGCAQVTSLASHPTKPLFVAVHSVCSGSSKSGMFSYDMPPKQARPTFVNDTLGVELATPSWTKDGNAVFFLGNTSWDTDNDGKADTQGIGIVGFDVAKSQLGGILPPLRADLSYQAISVGPNGTRMILCIFDVKKGESGLHLLDTTDKQNPIKALEEGKNNCEPSW